MCMFKDGSKFALINLSTIYLELNDASQLKDLELLKIKFNIKKLVLAAIGFTPKYI